MGVEMENLGFCVGDIVDSVGGNYKNGKVLEVEDSGIGTILTIEWENGKVEKRSSNIVRMATLDKSRVELASNPFVEYMKSTNDTSN